MNTKIKIEWKYKEKLHFTLLNYPLIYTFISKVSNVTFYPSKLLNCDNLTTLTFFFFQNAPITKKSKKKKFGVAELWGGSATPSIFFYFKKNKIKYVIGTFWEKKKSKWSNCHNLKVWGIKCHIWNFEGKSANG